MKGLGKKCLNIRLKDLVSLVLEYYLTFDF